MRARETCLIKIPSRISVDTRIARSRLLSLTDRPTDHLTVVISCVVVVFSVLPRLLLIAREKRKRLVNVITDNKCNWADRRRRREGRGLCNALLWQQGKRGLPQKASPNLIRNKQARGLGGRKGGNSMNLGRRPEGGFGSHEIEHGRGGLAMPVSPKDQITADTFCGGHAISIPSYMLPYTTYTPCKVVCCSPDLPCLSLQKGRKEGRTSTRTAFADSYYAYRGGDDVTVTGMKAKEHLGEREDERRNSMNVSSNWPGPIVGVFTSFSCLYVIFVSLRHFGIFINFA